MTTLIPIPGTLERQNRLLDVVFVHRAAGEPFTSWGLLRPDRGGERDSMAHRLFEDLPRLGFGRCNMNRSSFMAMVGSRRKEKS
ncbi:MAG: hypothetical protein ACK6AD_00840 [Cyanobacteriota bacterium]|jgi:hypothetical protein